jgi:hypothetical protein
LNLWRERLGNSKNRKNNMADERAIAVSKAETLALEAVKDRIKESESTNHAARYAFVAANKPQLFGAPQFSQCPQCDRAYRLFNNPFWKGDQSVCQACADENFAATREKMQKIEQTYGRREAEPLESTPGPFVALSNRTKVPNYPVYPP